MKWIDGEGGLRGSDLTIATLLVLLRVAVATIAILYPRATRSLVEPYQQPFVERAQREAARAFGTTPEGMARMSFPIALKLVDQTCVQLKPIRRGDGVYLACYDTRTGKLVEERVSGPSFGA